MKIKFIFLLTIMTPLLVSGQKTRKADSVEYYKTRAQAQIEVIGDYETAIRYLTRAIRLDPGYSDLYLLRGAALGKQGKMYAAAEDYSKVVQLDPVNITAHNERASAFMKLKKFKEAIPDYDFLIQQKPSYYGYYLNRGLCKWELGDKKGACTDYKKADQLGSRWAAKLIEDYCKD